MSFNFRLASFAVVAGLFASSAHAGLVTLDFSEQAYGNCSYVGTSLVSQGVKFTKTGSTTGFFACNNPGLIANNTTTKAMIDANARSQFDMVLQNGGAFDLLSLQAGARFDDPASGIRLTGTKSGGGSITTDLLFVGNNWGTFALSGFTNLTSVSWLALGNRQQFLFDNVVLNNTPARLPEPASLALVGVGILGAAASLRGRRRASRVAA
jgi:hypothetical protein